MEKIIQNSFEEKYSHESFWAKVTKNTLKAGREVIEKAFMLFYALQDDNVPPWAKGVILTALGYFISPVDAVPDVLPGGFVDDLGVMVAAIATVSAHLTEKTKTKARVKVDSLFG